MQYITSLPNLDYCNQFPRKLSICGSTGSIGESTLKIVSQYPELFEVIALGAGKNISLLAKQALAFRPKYLVVQLEENINDLKNLLSTDKSYSPEIFHGQEGYEIIASLDEVDTFISAQVGAAGLRSTFSAAKSGKVICLANKESLVLAGDLLREECKKTNASILPIDSEHHALFQCLHGHNPKDVRKLVLTASGGALRDKSFEFLSNAKASDALKHPNWSMGAKITIDSATLMNKGLEVIEACHLYGVDLSIIDVVVHPQSIIHSLVEYEDYSFIAQLSTPDMRLPIAHCLAYPQMLTGEKCELPTLSLAELGKLTFKEVNTKHFPCLDLAKKAFFEKKCVALNAVNEVLVEAFLKDRITFMNIPQLIEVVLEKSEKDPLTLEGILAADTQFRLQAYEEINKIEVR